MAHFDPMNDIHYDIIIIIIAGIVTNVAQNVGHHGRFGRGGIHDPILRNTKELAYVPAVVFGNPSPLSTKVVDAITQIKVDPNPTRR